MNSLKVSEIEITPIKAQSGLVGFASCVINDQFYIGNIAIHSCIANYDFRLVYPTRALPNGKSIDCIHPINKETGEAMQAAIVAAYKKLMGII